MDSSKGDRYLARSLLIISSARQSYHVRSVAQHWVLKLHSSIFWNMSSSSLDDNLLIY